MKKIIDVILIILLIIVSLGIGFYSVSKFQALEEPEVELVPLAVNPHYRPLLHPGDRMIISVASDQWQSSLLEWSLHGTGPKSPGKLSDLVGPATVYIAPQDPVEEVVISLEATRGDLKGQASVTFTIQFY